jgi:hypothetical protein
LDSHGHATTRAVTAPIVPVDDQPAPLVGWFAYTTQRRNRPRTLTTWQLTTTNACIAARVARLLGGHPHQQPAGSIQLVTDTAALPVVLDSPDAIRVQWLPGRGRTCDGRSQDNGRSCACPAALVLRRAAAKQGHGCQPSAKIRFRLLADPALGRFAFTSTDWSFVELAAEARTGLHDTGEPTAAWLSLRRTLHALRSGWELAYTRPVLVMLDDAR